MHPSQQVPRGGDQREEVEALTHSVAAVVEDHGIKGEYRGENEPRCAAHPHSRNANRIW